MNNQYDIIIVGGGIVGLSLACALARRTSLFIAILEAKSSRTEWNAAIYYHRVSAITLASQRIFESLGVWNDIQNKRISPFKKINVWDAAGEGHIDFDCTEIGESELGFIVENNAIQSVLEDNIRHYPSIHLYSSVTLKELVWNKENIELLTNETTFTAKLIVAADGAHSCVRKQIGIEVNQYDYHQQAMVATVHTALPHQQTAYQVFRETGSLAFLPFSKPNVSSIVWSLSTEEAQRYASMDDEIFKNLLAQAFDYKLGPIQAIEERHLFPLSRQQVEQYIKSRVVLVGDAAHVMHPLAGQGVNMGLLDAISLFDIIIQALNKNKDFASDLCLRQYERWRKADNIAMQTAVGMIKNMFASDQHLMKVLRSKGLNAVNHMAWIKKIFIRHAVGNRIALPTLAQKVYV